MIKLPEPVGYYNADWTVTPFGMADMRSKYPDAAKTFEPAYSKQAIRDALEEAAKVCDQEASEWGKCSDGHVSVQSIATAIRKLKEDIQ